MRHNEGESTHPSLEHSRHIQTQPGIVLYPENHKQISMKILNTENAVFYVTRPVLWTDVF